MTSFKCGVCGETYERDETWTEEDKIEEAIARYGYYDEKTMVTICHECDKIAYELFQEASEKNRNN